MKIKVCGMRDKDNIKSLASLKPDYIGFIFYVHSKRFVRNIDPAVLQQLDQKVKKTGVFVNASAEEVKKEISKYGLQAVQLHGSESPAMCLEIKQEGVEVIKAFGVDEEFDFESLKPYQNAVDFFLFDTKTSAYGGSGKAFNWQVLEKYRLDVPYFLSGGLSVENLKDVKKIKDSRMYALDLNSRFETEPGLKDMEMLKEAFFLVRQTK